MSKKHQPADYPRLSPGDDVILVATPGRTDLIGQSGIVKSPLTRVTLTDQGGRECLMYRVQFREELLWADDDALISISSRHFAGSNA
jgi:hypothetical protein